MPYWKIESFNLPEADMGLLELFFLNSNGANVLMFISENCGFGVCVQVMVMRRIFTNIWRHCFARVSGLPCVPRCGLEGGLHCAAEINIFK